jgi:hypothetical protein
VGSTCSQVLTSPKAAASRRAFVVLAAAKFQGSSREKLREPALTHNLLHGIPRPGYVVLAPTLGYQPALRLQCLREPAKEAVLMFDPVEGGSREGQIHRSL